ncbi:uncharacterized protein [Embiotoca jacksoni]|uniref:uncharacterized protein n=1 Tax=Embiotoca jacksoni TaxID=100190 RepID=UPI0037046A07
MDWQTGVVNVRFGGLRVAYLLFADDVVPLASDLQHSLGQFAYECEAAGMRVGTSKSEAMVVCQKPVDCSVQVSLQQPCLSLMSPDGRLLRGPEGVEVTRGHSFVFTCSVDSTHPPGVFFLVFSGSNRTDTEPVVNHSASFSFPAAEYRHQGNYSCVYEVSGSSRRFRSPQAAPITIIIKLPLSLLVSSIAAPPLLLLLVALVGCWVIRRKRRRAEPPGALTQVNLRNRCMVNNEEEEEEECVYVNCMRPQLSWKKDIDDDDDDDDEKRDTGNDREEEESDEEDNVYDRGEEIYVCVEEEEADGLYNTCENVETFPDDSPDIYGEVEQIYQNF